MVAYIIMDVTRATLSSCASATNSSRAPDVNIERYYEAAIDLHQAECILDAISPYDDILRFEPSYVSRPSSSSVAPAKVPEDPVLCDRYEALIASGPCASSMLSAAVSESSVDDELSIFDELVIRTFTIRKIRSFVEKTYVASRGLTVNKSVLHVEIVSSK